MSPLIDGISCYTDERVYLIRDRFTDAFQQKLMRFYLTFGAIVLVCSIIKNLLPKPETS
jgi:hypothetical protein